MVLSAQTWSGSEPALTSRVWQTADVAKGEAFDYYREGICAAFMPLRPKINPSNARSFEAKVQSYDVGDGVLNFVSATSHQVNRGVAEIAASPADCFYLNLQLGGQCQITQNGKTSVLSVGEVGIFDSSENFNLQHDKFPNLKVASLMLPKNSIPNGSSSETQLEPQILSRHPVYGAVIAETMKSLTDSINWASGSQVLRLQELIISLIGLSAQTTDNDAQTGNRTLAQLARVKRIVRMHCTVPGYSVADCAAETSLSPRYIHQLFENDEESFRSFLVGERLNIASRLLRNPAYARFPVSTISHDSGFKDPSHFSRKFRDRYGCTPAEWRNS